MKFFELKAILLLLTITLSVVSTNSLTTTRRRSASKSRSRALSRRAETRGISELLAKMREYVTQTPLAYYYLIWGLVGEFFPEIVEIWETIKNAATKFNECVNHFVETRSNIQALANVQSFEVKFDNPAKKAAFCVEAKKDVYLFHVDADKEHAHKNQKAGGWDFYTDVLYQSPETAAALRAGVTGFTGVFKSSEQLCLDIKESNAPILKADIASKYGSFESFFQQCEYFLNADCTDFEPVTGGLTEFVDTVQKTLDSIGAAGTCIGLKLDGPGEDLRMIREKTNGLFKQVGGFIKYLLKQALGAVLNVLTFGLWGGVKAGYYLVDLGIAIRTVYAQIRTLNREDFMYKIGQLFGKAIMIVKSLILGRRRRRIR